jgi:hypothetical protein
VRFLAGLWQKRLATTSGSAERQLTPKELGQLKMLKEALGELTRDVIAWMSDPVNWWHFCQQVCVESKVHTAPPVPHLGFLLAHYGIGLRLMRSGLRGSPAPADFIQTLDQRRYEQLKTLLVVLADGLPERLARIEAAKTLPDMQRVFVIIDWASPQAVVAPSA